MGTGIEWCDDTWNPVTGCTPVGAGCANCYARRMANRLRGRAGYDQANPFAVTVRAERLHEPSGWKRARRVFVCSMGDLFHEEVQEVWQRLVFEEMEKCARHTFFVLTKRPDRMAAFVCGALPVSNVWLGVSVENRAAAGRVEWLKEAAGWHRFVSAEPLLEELSLAPWLKRSVHWVIAGAEQGPGARPMEWEWARKLMRECRWTGTPFFFKRGPRGRRVPPDLQLREWPAGAGRDGTGPEKRGG